MPRKGLPPENPEEFRSKVIRLLMERGFGSTIRIRRVVVSGTGALQLEQHLGFLRSLSIRRSFDDAARELQFLHFEFGSRASARGGLELLGRGDGSLWSDGKITPMELSLPADANIRVRHGVVRFGEPDPRLMTHEAGMTPLVYTRIWFDIDRIRTNGIPTVKAKLK